MQRTTRCIPLSEGPVPHAREIIPGNPVAPRGRFPRIRSDYRRDVEIGGTDFGITVKTAGAQRLGGVFLDHSKHGSLARGLVATSSELLSAALACGMPLEEFGERFLNICFDPHGLTDDPEVRWVRSPMHYLALCFARDFPPSQRQIAMGVLAVGTSAAPLRLPPRFACEARNCGDPGPARAAG